MYKQSPMGRLDMIKSPDNEAESRRQTMIVLEESSSVVELRGLQLQKEDALTPPEERKIDSSLFYSNYEDEQQEPKTEPLTAKKVNKDFTFQDEHTNGTLKDYLEDENIGGQKEPSQELESTERSKGAKGSSDNSEAPQPTKAPKVLKNQYRSITPRPQINTKEIVNNALDTRMKFKSRLQKPLKFQKGLLSSSQIPKLNSLNFANSSKDSVDPVHKGSVMVNDSSRSSHPRISPRFSQRSHFNSTITPSRVDKSKDSQLPTFAPFIHKSPYHSIKAKIDTNRSASRCSSNHYAQTLGSKMSSYNTEVQQPPKSPICNQKRKINPILAKKKEPVINLFKDSRSSSFIGGRNKGGFQVAYQTQKAMLKRMKDFKAGTLSNQYEPKINENSTAVISVKEKKPQNYEYEMQQEVTKRAHTEIPVIDLQSSTLNESEFASPVKTRSKGIEDDDGSSKKHNFSSHKPVSPNETQYRFCDISNIQKKAKETSKEASKKSKQSAKSNSKTSKVKASVTPKRTFRKEKPSTMLQSKRIISKINQNGLNRDILMSSPEQTDLSQYKTCITPTGKPIYKAKLDTPERTQNLKVKLLEFDSPQQSPLQSRSQIGQGGPSLEKKSPSRLKNDSRFKKLEEWKKDIQIKMTNDSEEPSKPESPMVANLKKHYSISPKAKRGNSSEPGSVLKNNFVASNSKRTQIASSPQATPVKTVKLMESPTDQIGLDEETQSINNQDQEVPAFQFSSKKSPQELLKQRTELSPQKAALLEQREVYASQHTYDRASSRSLSKKRYKEDTVSVIDSAFQPGVVERSSCQSDILVNIQQYQEISEPKSLQEALERVSQVESSLVLQQKHLAILSKKNKEAVRNYENPFLAQKSFEQSVDLEDQIQTLNRKISPKRRSRQDRNNKHSKRSLLLASLGMKSDVQNQTNESSTPKYTNPFVLTSTIAPRAQQLQSVASSSKSTLKTPHIAARKEDHLEYEILDQDQENEAKNEPGNILTYEKSLFDREMLHSSSQASGMHYESSLANHNENSTLVLNTNQTFTQKEDTKRKQNVAEQIQANFQKGTNGGRRKTSTSPSKGSGKKGDRPQEEKKTGYVPAIQRLSPTKQVDSFEEEPSYFNKCQDVSSHLVYQIPIQQDTSDMNQMLEQCSSIQNGATTNQNNTTILNLIPLHEGSISFTTSTKLKNDDESQTFLESSYRQNEQVANRRPQVPQAQAQPIMATSALLQSSVLQNNPLVSSNPDEHGI